MNFYDQAMSGRLTDGEGRAADYLRVSVTDRCNLRCAYCMPHSGMAPAPNCDILTIKEILRLNAIFAGLGVRKFRFTGGEPLVRRGIVNLIRQTRQTPGVMRTALTTNGLLLEKMAAPLKEAGLDVVNVSLDSLRPERYAAITGADGLAQATRGILAAIQAPIPSVKINMVVMRDVNDGEIEDFVRLAAQWRVQVRFIEYMPATPSSWRKERFYPMDQVMERAFRAAKLEPAGMEQWGGPAQVFRLAENGGEVGFISPVTRHFCGSCNRLRLTAEGKLLTCLFSMDSLDLKSLLRSSHDDGRVGEAIADYARMKPAARDMETFAEKGRGAMHKVGG